MPDIPFTQYLRPNGEKRPVTIDRPKEVADKAQALFDAGYRLECEELNTGHVSFTVVGKNRDGVEDDLAFEICPNGPDVPGAVDRLITKFEIPR